MKIIIEDIVAKMEGVGKETELPEDTVIRFEHNGKNMHFSFNSDGRIKVYKSSSRGLDELEIQCHSSNILFIK